ncbi:M28 family metallopeptidase [Mucilaginibacter sp. RCC_168]|uniref:M28 family metallopeptidase n=1 Tax=Mucilaginibacter sp. RCC_168 TaxID=3239221 RepID=UPI0035257E77
MMIRVVLIVFIGIIPGAVIAKCGLPRITNVKIFNNLHLRSLIVTYDIEETESDFVKVSLHVFTLKGVAVNLGSSKVFGDAGTLMGGGNKKIVWRYGNLKLHFIRVQLKIDNSKPIDIQCIVNSVDSMRIKQILSSIYGIRNRISGLKHLEHVKLFIKSQLDSCHVLSAMQQFRYSGYTGHNIIGHIPGQKDKNGRYLLTAHFDTAISSPGADDNGSGVAGLLEAMNVLSRYNFGSSVDFVAFDQEEPGSVGSKNYVSDISKKKYKIKGVINLDMIGRSSIKVNSQYVPPKLALLYPFIFKDIEMSGNKADFVLDITNKTSRRLGEIFKFNSNKFNPSLKVVTLETNRESVKAISGLEASDHVRFWEKGYPALHIGEGGETRNPTLDTPYDKIELINYTFIRDVVKSVVASLISLAKIENYNTYTFKVNLLKSQN